MQRDDAKKTIIGVARIAMRN